MQNFLYYMTTLMVVAVIVVLFIGLWTMLRGKSPNLSQKIMQWRVALQFLAIVVIAAYVFVANFGS